MKEFGSDFHLITGFQSKRLHLTDLYHDMVLLADGRQCIVALIRQEKWRRLWIPEYFCYEVIETIKEQTGIEVRFYPDYPFQDDNAIVKTLPYEKGDVLLRMNYFGMRGHRSAADIPIPVIEDHSHDYLGPWALHSDADWCIASLRKTLPLAEGGMIWSPQGHRLELDLQNTKENQQKSDERWHAMKMKADYLQSVSSDKKLFRQKFIMTEAWFDVAELSLIDEMSRLTIEKMNIITWMKLKERNWNILINMINEQQCEILKPENEQCKMFSLIILMKNWFQRDSVRKGLLSNAVYPAILWNVPKETSKETRNFSERMLSIHCDGRYSEKEIEQLAVILNNALKK